MVLNLKALKKLFLGLIVVLGLVSLGSCSESKTGEQSKITKSLKLDRAFEGKDFYNDGIGEATFFKPTDGDTAQFKLKANNDRVIIRFYSIDTPESTGSVEKWGKSASKYTEEKLTNAHRIVLEASTTPASVDSYGERYLAYVWYQETADSEWMNLNLQIVENGFSKNEGSKGSALFKYNSVFDEAQAAAKKNKLHIWGEEDDPYYSTEAQEITLKDLNDNLSLYFNEESQTGSKIRFTAFLKSLEISGGDGSRKYTFEAAQLIDGKLYTFNVYAGYESKAQAEYMKLGNVYTMTGSIQKFAGKYQISGLTYVPLETGGDYLYRTKKSYYLTFDSAREWKSYEGTSLYQDAKVTAATIDGNNIKLTATSVRSDDLEGEAETFNIIVPNTNSLTDVTSLVGKSMKFQGFQEEKGTVNVLKYSDIEFK